MSPSNYLNRNPLVESFINCCDEMKQLVYDKVNLADVLLLEYVREQAVKKIKIFSLRGIINFFWRLFIADLFLGLYSKKTKRINVIFFATDITHVNQQLPVYRFILSQGKTASLVTTKYPFIKELRKTNANSIGLENSIWNKVTSLLEYRRFVHRDLKIVGSFLRKSSDPSLAKKIIATINQQWPGVLQFQKIFLKFLSNSKPDAVFIGNDLTWEGRLFSLCCKAKGIKCFSISHGLVELNSYYRFIRVDNFFCWGKREHDIMMSYGVPSSKVKISGSPYIDEKNNNQKLYFEDSNIQEFFNSFGSASKTLITLSGRGHSTSAAHHEWIINVLFHFILKNPDRAFVLKLHKKDNPLFYRMLSGFENVRIVHSSSSSMDQSIDKWITYSDVLITGASTTALDAMVRRKPVITIDLQNEYSHVEFIARGITVHCSSAESLAEGFKQVTTDNLYVQEQLKKQDAFITEYFYKTETGASQKIYDFIGISN